MAMSLTLYGGPRTRASMPRWYLEEKGISYELKELDLRGNQHRQPDYLAINPFGKLPALVDTSRQGMDGQPLTLFESGAILLHLAEHHAGEITSASQRSLIAQWLLFANATLAIALFVPSNREREFPRLMEELNRQLAPGRPLVGDHWGAADCAGDGVSRLPADLLSPGGSFPLSGDSKPDHQHAAATGLPQGDGHGLSKRGVMRKRFRCDAVVPSGVAVRLSLADRPGGVQPDPRRSCSGSGANGGAIAEPADSDRDRRWSAGGQAGAAADGEHQQLNPATRCGE